MLLPFDWLSRGHRPYLTNEQGMTPGRPSSESIAGWGTRGRLLSLSGNLRAVHVRRALLFGKEPKEAPMDQTSLYNFAEHFASFMHASRCKSLAGGPSVLACCHVARG